MLISRDVGHRVNREKSVVFLYTSNEQSEKDIKWKFVTTSKITKVLKLNFNQGHHKLKPVEHY